MRACVNEKGSVAVLAVAGKVTPSAFLCVFTKILLLFAGDALHYSNIPRERGNSSNDGVSQQRNRVIQ